MQAPIDSAERERRAARLAESVAAVLSGAKARKLNIIVLNKALFYLDLFALRDLGWQITEATFLALPMGPAVAKYDKRVVAEVERRGIAKQLAEGMAKPVALIAEPKYSQLTKPELELAREIGRNFDGLTSALVSSASHDNLGWKAARAASEGGGPARPINMLLALQQLDAVDAEAETDSWLQVGPDAAFESAIASVDGSVEPW